MKNILFLLLFSLISTISFSQRPSDYELWTGGSFGFKMNKRLSLELTEQFRINDTISTLKKSFTELAFKVKANKFISFRAGYRYNVRPNKTNEHRLTIDGVYSWSKKGFPLSISYRLRYQNLFGKNKMYVRNKLGLKYNLSKRVDPYAAYEIYFRFNGKNEFRVSRLTVGLDWRIIKPLHLITYYRLQDDIFVKSPERQHIFGLLLEYKLKLKKKNSKPK